MPEANGASVVPTEATERRRFRSEDGKVSIIAILRITLLSVAGFLIPILLAIALVPQLFPASTEHAAPDVDDFYARAALNDEKAPHLPEVAQGAPEPSTSYLSVAETPLHDPVDGKIFLVSARFRFDALPKIGKRARLAMKYSNQSKRYPGWALAIRRFDTSVRPELYYEPGDGTGGWWSFDHVNIRRGVPYQLTVVVRGRDLMSACLEELPGGPAEDLLAEQAPAGIRFLGAYSIADVQSPRTDAPLLVAPAASKGEFRGALDEILIARLDEFPLRKENLVDSLRGGMPALLELVPESARVLWISDGLTDKSPQKLAVQMRGAKQ